MAEAQDTTNPFQGVNVSTAADQIASLMGDDGDLTEGEVTNRDRLESGDDVESEEQPTAAAEDSDEEEEEEVETEASDQTDDEETDDESEEPELIRNIDEWADALEIPKEQLLDTLETTFTRDGQEETVTLRELQDSYYRESDYTRKTQELAEERKTFQAHQTEAHQGYERNNAVLANVMQRLQEKFLQPPDQAMMERLRYEDTAEFNAQLLGYQQRVADFNEILGQAAQQYDQVSGQMGEAQQAEIERVIKEQQDLLRAAVPEWGDGMRSSLYEFATAKYGFTTEELQNTVDNRTIQMALDAQKYHALKAAEPKVKKGLSKVPKIKAPGKKKAPRSQAQLNADKVRSVKAKARQSGKVRDAAAAIETMDI